MSDPYKVVVWGPGGLGRIIIREVTARREFELVGGLAYSDTKNGVDLGEIAGIDRLGVAATTDVEAALAIDCDCVLHATRDYGIYNSLDEIVRILEAGRNVITIHAYHLPSVMALTAAPDDAVDRIRAACERGGSTFHCTGIHPEFFCNRVVGTLSGLSSEITSIEISENWDACHISREQLEPLGFGASPDEAAELPHAAMFANNYALMNLHCVAESLGVEYERLESEHEHIPAPHDLPEFPNGMRIAEGRVARLTHRYTGHVAGVTPPMTVTVEVNWMVGREAMLPEHITTDDYYIVTIEGRPSLRIGLGIKGSFADSRHFVIDGDETSEPGYHGTVVTMLQNLPRVLAADPGWLELVHPTPHWAPTFADAWGPAPAAIS